MTSRRKKQNPWKVFLGIILGMIAGSLTQRGSLLFGFDLFPYVYPVYTLCGKVFINALTLIVVPLVSSSIITGIARIGSDGSFGKLSTKIFGYYLGTSLLAILIGLLFVNLINPGSVIPLESMLASTNLSGLEQQLATQETVRFSDVLLQIVPSNIIDTFGKGQMLGLIFFSILFGYSLSKIESTASSTLMGFFQGLFQTMIQFTHIIMKVLPWGVFFLVAKVFAEAGFKSLASLGLFTLAVLLGLAFFMFIALPLLLRILGRVRPGLHFKAMAPALITAFSTSSSSATLPITLDCVEKRAGVSNKICSLVVPLGTSINMSGSALYECVAAMFVAQAYGIDLSFTTQFLIVFFALITSIGVAGIPSASLVAIIAILKAIGLPIEGIGLFIAVDRVLDMCRTTVNVFSDSCCAVLVARSEGEKKVLTKEVFEE
jgi:proton glutamate symport protein